MASMGALLRHTSRREELSMPERRDNASERVPRRQTINTQHTRSSGPTFGRNDDYNPRDSRSGPGAPRSYDHVIR